MNINDAGLEQVADLMLKMGARKIVFKLLANNDNSKNQIYLGSDFRVIQLIPSGNVSSHGTGKKGAIFKSPLNFHWISLKGERERAAGAQLILYPDYPEVRLSGLLKGCKSAPSELMRVPTKAERDSRSGNKRCMVLGLLNDGVLAYVSAWGSRLSLDAQAVISETDVSPVAAVLYEYSARKTNSRETLLERLRYIWQQGAVRSCRLNKNGERIEYRARNGAGYTLESMFGISPNGFSEPDFMGWEIKAHSGGAVTLMTPEPNEGTYLISLENFLRSHATKLSAERMDFASRHSIGAYNSKSGLTLLLEGYDPVGRKITDPEGGLKLRDGSGNLTAGWSFSKLIDHWKRKHAQTCFVLYSMEIRDVPYYTFGPSIVLGFGTDLEKFLAALHSSTIYFDPGINMKIVENRWIPKKRNQFRISWKNLGEIYAELEEINLADFH